MSAHLLTLNAGSSSLKFALFSRDTLATRLVGQIEGLGSDPELKISDGEGRRLHHDALEGSRAVASHGEALVAVLAALGELAPEADVVAVGHRVVHGGMRHSSPVFATDEVVAELGRLNPLAPLHQPHNLAGIVAARVAFPHTPQVACFDTAFHRGHDFVNDAFALPRALHDEGVRRYGFHGLSYAYLTQRLGEVAPELWAGRTVICHLGAGASMCAVRGGRSVASTMGFSALDGLPMATRPGQLDPGVLLYLMQEKGMTAAAISDLLYRQSGLKGLSGLSGDMRELLGSQTTEAGEALAYFVARARREIGAMAAALEGLDGIVFSGGIGENAAPIRQRILDGLRWLGVVVDPLRNSVDEARISTDASPVAVLVIPTNEELMIARHTRALIDKAATAIPGDA